MNAYDPRVPVPELRKTLVLKVVVALQVLTREVAGFLMSCL